MQRHTTAAAYALLVGCAFGASVAYCLYASSSRLALAEAARVRRPNMGTYSCADP